MQKKQTDQKTENRNKEIERKWKKNIVKILELKRHSKTERQTYLRANIGTNKTDRWTEKYRRKTDRQTDADIKSLAKLVWLKNAIIPIFFLLKVVYVCQKDLHFTLSQTHSPFHGQLRN